MLQLLCEVSVRNRIVVSGEHWAETVFYIVLHWKGNSENQSKDVAYICLTELREALLMSIAIDCVNIKGL